MRPTITRTRAHSRAVLLAGLLAAALGLAAWTTHAARTLEDTTISLRFRAAPAHTPKDIAIVAIDDATFSDLDHAWPFPRRWHAAVIDQLRRMGAKQVVYDVQFTERTTARDDWALYDAVGRMPHTVLATTEIDENGHTNVLGGDDRLAAIGARAAMATFPTIAGGGIARVEPQRDGVSTIAVAAAQMMGHDVDSSAFESDGAWISYRGPPGTIPSMSFSDVKLGKISPSQVRGKVVVVGMTSPTLQDVHPTPASSDDLMAGPEVQANALWTVLHDLPLRTAPWWASVLAILLLALAPAGAALRMRTLSVLTTPLMAVAYMGVAQLAFAKGWILPIVPALGALAISTIGTVTASYLAERRERRRVSRENVVLERAVRERTNELHETQLEVVHRLARAAEWRDEDTGEHVERIGLLCELLGRATGMTEAQAEMLRHAAVLHDIGKIGVPDRVLLKPGPLDEDEWKIMKTHPEIGASMLSDSRSPLVQLGEQIARTHHERWDGTGYPAGLRGEQIPLPGRICAIVDVYDALRSRRPYKAAWPADEALAELQRQRGRHFDPVLVDLFREVARDLPAGLHDDQDGPSPLQLVA